MTDIMTPEQRHFCMSQIHGTNTRPEMLVRKWLWRNGYRYRKNDKQLPGKPDIVLPRFKTVVFINGCFWHGHENCKAFHLPKSNVEYWQNKIDRNRQRDHETYLKLYHLGWHVLIVWECQLKKQNAISTLQALTVRLSQIYLKLNRATPVAYINEQSQESVVAEPTPTYSCNSD